jgi:hypothetical protein
MLVELTEKEIIFIRSAAREYRTAVPKIVKESPGRLERWIEERELYDDSRSSVDRKMTDILANMVN